MSHVLQDDIYRKFIRDICNNKFATTKNVVTIANLINKNVVKHDHDRWYA